MNFLTINMPIILIIIILVILITDLSIYFDFIDLSITPMALNLCEIS